MVSKAHPLPSSPHVVLLSSPGSGSIEGLLQVSGGSSPPSPPSPPPLFSPGSGSVEGLLQIGGGGCVCIQL